MELRIVRFDGESRTKLLNCMIKVALLKVGDAQVFAKGSIISAELECPKVERNCSFGVALLHKGKAEIGEYGGVLGACLGDLLKEGHSFARASTRLESQGKLVLCVERRGG